MNLAVADKPKRPWRKFVINFILGAAVGAGSVFLIDTFFPGLPEARIHMRGLWIGIVLFALGLYLIWVASRPQSIAKVMGTAFEPGEDVSAEAATLRGQGLVTILAGAELLILAWDRDVLLGPAGPLLLAGLLLLTGVQTWLNWRLWRRGDEFFRRLLVESSVISMIAAQFIFFLWAVGARFGHLPEPAALDVYVAFIALYLLAGVVVGIRRGIGN